MTATPASPRRDNPDRTAGSDGIRIAPADPDGAWAQACLAAYFAELAARFDGGFDPGPGPHGAGFRPPDGAFVVALRGDSAVGCVGLVQDPLGDGAPLAEVKRLWVAPAARGTGLAMRLMAAAETEARRAEVERLVLDTNRVLTEAVAFYRRAGWTEIARYNDNPYAHHWFEKRLA